MKTKRSLLSAVLVLAMFVLANCLYSNVRAPGPVNYITQYTLTSQDFKVLGEVEASGQIKTVLALFAWGGNGHQEIMKKAKAMGGDAIMNYTFNLESYSIVTFVYNVATWKARATVVRYNDSLRASGRMPKASEPSPITAGSSQPPFAAQNRAGTVGLPDSDLRWVWRNADSVPMSGAQELCSLCRRGWIFLCRSILVDRAGRVAKIADEQKAVYPDPRCLPERFLAFWLPVHQRTSTRSHQSFDPAYTDHTGLQDRWRRGSLRCN